MDSRCRKVPSNIGRPSVQAATSLPGPNVEGCALVVGTDIPLLQAIGLTLGLGRIRHRIANDFRGIDDQLHDAGLKLILLDLDPEGAALDLCRRVKDDPATHHLPVLMVSGSTDPDDELGAFEAGADGYFGRDAHPGVLLARARAAMRTCAFNQELRGRRHAMKSELDLVWRWSKYAVHDMQGPLTVALGNLQLVRQLLPPLTGVASESMGDIERAMGQVQALIKDLLDFDRLASGLLALRRTQVDLGTMVREVAHETEPLARRYESALEVTGKGAISCDAALVRRVLGNLVANALKFGGARGPVRIVVETEKGAGVRVAVIDKGCGVPEAMRSRLFSLYGREAGDPRPGYGIGLAFSRLVVEAHGGRIWLEDPPDGGAAFVFSLPAT